MKLKIGILIFCVFLFLYLQVGSGLTAWEQCSIALFAFFFLIFLADLGKKVVILDFTILMALLTCLVMPVIFYHVYSKDNPLARLWVKYMFIPSDEYFSFAIPGILALALGIKIPFKQAGPQFTAHPEKYLDRARQYLADKPKMGLYLVGVGLLSGFLKVVAPGGFEEVFFLMAHLIFVGVFYVIYSPNKHKKYVVPAVILLMLGTSVATGMFGEIVNILACALAIILLGKKIAFWKKLSFSVVGIFLIVLIQSVKTDYRKATWKGAGAADPILYTELITQKIADPASMVNPTSMFLLGVRMNQGWLVAVTMYMVPARFSFGNGGPLAQAVAAAFVPRFLWPDKPQAGGKFNLERFWGFKLVGWSTNIGTLGEAYANFGRTGGIIYLFCYGLFFNFALSFILRKSKQRPTLVLWLPYLFFYAITVETDLLSTMGALIKAGIFAWIIFMAFDRFFHMKL
jgi:hypothetical protein